MRKTGEMRYAETDDVQAVELAYKGGETSMTVLLPKKADGLAAVEKGLSAETLDKVWKGMADHNVVLTLPRALHRALHVVAVIVIHQRFRLPGARVPNIGQAGHMQQCAGQQPIQQVGPFTHLA